MAGRARRSRTDSPDRLARRESGRAALLPIRYPDLPVAERRDEIAAAIRDHQVVIVAGETGSGKTTQLPKICLELGRGVAGLIGHTQPRRLAARTVADRIAEELGVELGEAVGYTVRFTDQAGADTLVRLMTDGILLAEIQRDRDLQALRHDHHRRGARAQPQHRLPARLPQAAAAPPARPQGHHHLGDHRHRAVRRALRRRAGRRGVRPDLSGRDALPAAVRSRRPGRRGARPDPGGARRRRRAAAARGRATCWCSSPASARSATPPTRCAGTSRRPANRRGAAAVRPAVGRRAAPGLRAAPRAGASCWPPTSPRPR